jgi:hypothetical protein
MPFKIGDQVVHPTSSSAIGIGQPLETRLVPRGWVRSRAPFKRQELA